MNGNIEWISDFRSIIGSYFISSLSYPIFIGIVQHFYGVLGISTKFVKLGSFFGVINITISNILSSLVFLVSNNVLERMKNDDLVCKDNAKKFKWKFEWSDCNAKVIMAISLFYHKFLFKSKFVTMIPSHLCYPGAFAHESIKAASTSYATNDIRKKINIIGNKHGCHSCGSYKKPFISDHQPPNFYVKTRKVTQRFFPQCKNCALLQGISIFFNNRKHMIKQHYFTIRKHHIWFPYPLLTSCDKNMQ